MHHGSFLLFTQATVHGVGCEVLLRLLKARANPQTSTMLHAWLTPLDLQEYHTLDDAGYNSKAAILELIEDDFNEMVAEVSMKATLRGAIAAVVAVVGRPPLRGNGLGRVEQRSPQQREATAATATTMATWQ
jgi:hypothetical protein